MPSAFLDLLVVARPRIRPPVLITPAAPRLIADIAAALGLRETACFQFDLYQAERLCSELHKIGDEAAVLTAADLWDLPVRFATVLVPSPPRGERELKRDLVEQAYHVLGDGGRLIVLSPVRSDQFFAPVIKKIYGKSSAENASGGTIVTGVRHGDKPRRRHEITFHVRNGDDSLVFVSRPGVFSYGRMDEGARALADVMQIEPGDRILDLGCGSGTVGVLAARRAGNRGSVTFVDSHLRAVALAEQNARANGVKAVTAVAAVQLEGLPRGAFDVALANPPYYAQQGVTQLFVAGAKQLLAPGGRLYLVTKHPDFVGEIIAAEFREPMVELRRGYAVFGARK